MRVRGWARGRVKPWWIAAMTWAAACGPADGAPRDEARAGPPAGLPEQAEAGLRAGASTTVTELLPDTSLARLVAEIQPSVERSAGMRATAPLDVAATDEARLRDYLESQITTQLTPAEAEAITRTYARLGLVPDTLDLRGLLLALLQEQVVGYYDPRTDTLFVHDRVGMEQLEPVLAHELVHALQDQRLPLDSLGDALSEKNDASTASQAAIEGHATFAMMEWQFGSMMGTEADLTTLPDLGPMLENLDLSALGDVGPVEVLSGAPRVVREGLIFPYVGGLVFLQRAWKELPDRPLPFGDALPASTEQVLHVDRWLAADEPTTVRFPDGPPPGWTIVHERDLGELETRIFLAEHLGDEERARSAAAGWDGDAYRLLEGEAGEALVWVSVWDSEADAKEFAEAAASAWARRYGGSAERVRVERGSIAGRPAVTVLDAPPAARLPDAVARVELWGGAGPGTPPGGP